MTPEVAHDLRNGIMGVYCERKKILATLLKTIDVLETTKRSKKLKYQLHLNIMDQINCVRRMDAHLERMKRALK